MKTSLNQMMCLDFFINSLASSEYHKIKDNLKTENSFINLLSSDIYLNNYSNLINNTSKDLLNLEEMAENYGWKNDIKTILKDHSFEALVLTDVSKKIVWVNDGFSKMTGYSKKFAINKTPSFLHGKKTLPTSKKIIREQLNKKTSFKEVIINYKKNNTAYKCELHIFPLYKKGEITHFLALEKEVA